jgi:SWI/SNF-related matrix-associated actin-dependent regulator 1 of chromatin subfamily A
MHADLVRATDREEPCFKTNVNSPIEMLLHPYQREAVRFWRRYGRVMFAMEMGLGKTITAIACADSYLRSNQNTGPVLIICPSPLKLNWQAEIARFSPTKCHTSLVKTSKSSVDYDADYVIVSLSLVSKINWAKRFTFIITDESHLIKTMTSKRSKTVRRLCRSLDPTTQAVILLSGTPSSRTQDLYAQLKCLAGKAFFPDFFPVHKPYLVNDPANFYFAQRYCKPTKVFVGRGQFQFTFKGSDNQEELHQITSVFVFRKTKTDVLSELPDKIRKRVVIHENDKQKFEKSLQTIEQVKESQGDKAAGLLISKLTRALAPMKAKHALKFLQTVQCEKLLLFAHHRQVLDILEEYCTAQEGGSECFIRIDGKVSMKSRALLVQKFQNDPQVKYAILSIKAAGTGLNLFAGNTVVFVELLWNVKDMLQSEDRAHRLGQKKKVTVYYLLIQHSVDMLMWQSLNSQVKNMGLVVDNKPNQYLLSSR